MNIKQKLVLIFVEMLGVEESALHQDATIRNDLGADSLDFVELVMRAERDFGIDIPDEAMDNIKTFGQFLEYVKHKHSENN